jgi:hypothetical protein
MKWVRVRVRVRAPLHNGDGILEGLLGHDVPASNLLLHQVDECPGGGTAVLQWG